MEPTSKQSLHTTISSAIHPLSEMVTPKVERDETTETTYVPFKDNVIVISKEQQLIQAGVCFLATVISDNYISLDGYLSEYKKVLSEGSDIDFSTPITSQILSV